MFTRTQQIWLNTVKICYYTVQNIFHFLIPEIISIKMRQSTQSVLLKSWHNSNKSLLCPSIILSNVTLLCSQVKPPVHIIRCTIPVHIHIFSSLTFNIIPPFYCLTCGTDTSCIVAKVLYVFGTSANLTCFIQYCLSTYIIQIFGEYKLCSLSSYNFF